MSDPFPLTGTRIPEPAPRRLRAGRLSADLVAGNLRTVSWDGVEVLRAVAYLLRDRDWGTYEPEIAGLSVEEKDEGFRVAFRAACGAADGSRLAFDAAIAGSAEGRLDFSVTAVPEGDFETNRCGFCILHPIANLAGAPVTVEHVDGRSAQTRLPALIEPWQPFKDMRAIAHAVAPGVRAECRMEGDTRGMDGWEMEDQRNWTDASFKTYVRPLALPWPYTLPSGEAVRQSVRLTISGAGAPARPPAGPHDDVVAVRPEGDGPVLPGIGVVVYPDDADAALREVDRLRELGPQHLLFHFDPTAGHGLEALRAFADLAEAYPARTALECVVAAEGGSRADLDGELSRTAALVAEAGLRLDAIAVCLSVDRRSTPPGSAWPDCPAPDAVHAAARRAFPGQKLGGGMFSYFTELNRKRVPQARLDFITHCTNPIVHAADDLSVMQTLEALPSVTASARAIYGSMPYRIGPSTIPMRQNPYGSATKENPDGERIPMADRDPRHNALFGAAWAAGHSAAVAQAGLEALTLSGFCGPFGVLAGENEPAPAGAERPLFHVVQALAAMAGKASVRVSTNGDRRAAVAAARDEGGLRLVCANLTPSPLALDIAGMPPGAGRSLSLLDGEAVGRGAPSSMPFAGSVLRLDPYAVAFVT